MGTDNKLARWDKIVDYFKQVSGATDRIRFRELGKSTNGNPFVALEIASADTLKNLDATKQLQRKLYFQGGAPTDAERDEIFRQGKAVVLITTTIHATEIGASQMVVELVHRLATDNSPQVKKILDNVIFVLVPSLNPDGQIMVTDWFNKNLDTPFANSQIPYLYHPYVGHDNNRDMYMFTQKESQLTAKLLWHDWYPVGVARRAPAGQQRRAHLRDARDRSDQPERAPADLSLERHPGPVAGGRARGRGQGRDHLQLHLHELLAGGDGVERLVAQPDRPAHRGRERARRRADRAAARRPRAGAARRAAAAAAAAGLTAAGPLPPPTDTNSRTEYPRPWLGGRWTLRDIVDYELIATMALLDTVADRREALLQQIYEVNRVTVENGKKSDPSAILIPVDTQHDPHEAMHLVDKLQMAGVDVYRADAAFEADGQKYAAGTFVIPMAQVFSRYAKDILEKQTYPEVRRSPTSPPEPPYDVTAWSLGMLLGVDHVVRAQAAGRHAEAHRGSTPRRSWTARSPARGPRFVFDYRGPDAAKAINRLLKDGARLSLDKSRVWVLNAPRKSLDAVAAELGLQITAADAPAPAARRGHQGAAHRHVFAVDRRQHGRGLDALGPRAVRLQPDDAAQRRRPRRQAARQVRRDHPPRPGAAARSSRAPPGRTSGPSTAAASATTGSPRCRISSAREARWSRSARPRTWRSSASACRSRT